jgi:hypothetical protein
MLRLILLTLFFPLTLLAQDLIETKPRSTFWSKSDSSWILFTLFEQAEVKTFFRTAPPETGVGISPEYTPVKQEFYLHASKESLVTRACTFIQHLDGTKSWGFSYDGSFVQDGKTYTNLSVIMTEKPEFDAFYICSEVMNLSQ